VNNAPRFWLSLRKGEKGKGGLKIKGVGKENYQEGTLVPKQSERWRAGAENYSSEQKSDLQILPSSGVS
jgi:hypothetical protein